MDCNDFRNTFVSVDAELLEDVEQPNLTSLSDSQLSSRDFLSDYHSSGTFENSSLNINKANENIDYSKDSCLLDRKHPLTDAENNFASKLTKYEKFGFDFVVPGMQSSTFNEKEFKHLAKRLCKDKTTMKSLSLSNLNTFRIEHIFKGGQNSDRLNRCSINSLSQSKRCFSLPNLDFSPKYGKKFLCFNDFMQTFPYNDKASAETFMKISAHVTNINCFGDFLIKMLLKRLHSLQFTIKEKDEMISELMHSYDKLLIKHAEAENKIDRMRFDLSSSSSSNVEKVIDVNDWEEGQSIFVSSLNQGIQDSTCKHVVKDNIFGPYEVPGHTHFVEWHSDERDVIFPSVEPEKGIRNSKSKNNETAKKKIIYEKTSTEVRALDKRMGKYQAIKDDILVQGDFNLHWCKPTNKMNLEKLEIDILDNGNATFPVKELLFDPDSSTASEDEFSLSSQETCESIGTATPVNCKKLLKNNFNYSYNKIITYAKAKRELTSYPEFHQLIYGGNESGLYESLPNFRTLKLQENYIGLTEEKSNIFLSENGNFEVNDTRITPNENFGLIHRKLEYAVETGVSSVNTHIIPNSDNNNTSEDIHFTKKSLSSLNNVMTEEKDANNRGDESSQKYFYSRNADSNISITFCDMEETSPMINRLQLEIKNDFGEMSCNASPQYGKQLTSTEKRESYLDESEGEHSVSLGSVKLETCDCWNEPSVAKFYPPHINRNKHEQEKLFSQNNMPISPLCLDLSSSIDYSLSLFGTVSLDHSIAESYETKSVHDTVISDEEMDGLSKAHIKAKFRKVPLTKLRSGSGKNIMSLQDVTPVDYDAKKISQIINSLNKMDILVSKLKSKSGEMKKYLSLQLNNIS